MSDDTLGEEFDESWPFYMKALFFERRVVRVLFPENLAAVNAIFHTQFLKERREHDVRSEYQLLISLCVCY